MYELYRSDGAGESGGMLALSGSAGPRPYRFRIASIRFFLAAIACGPRRSDNMNHI